MLFDMILAMAGLALAGPYSTTPNVVGECLVPSWEIQSISVTYSDESYTPGLFFSADEPTDPRDRVATMRTSLQHSMRDLRSY